LSGDQIIAAVFAPGQIEGILLQHAASILFLAWLGSVPSQIAIIQIESLRHSFHNQLESTGPNPQKTETAES
jgi:hypothetical protein